MASLSESDSPLHSAVRKGQLEEVRKILDEPDVDVNCLNSKHETALHLACYLRHSSIIELLIVFGANIFINNKDLFNRITYEDCNLINDLLYSQTLWLKGPTLTEKNTPLRDAVRLGQLERVQDILDQKSVGVNDKNSANETPLHLACALGYNGIVRMLMINGASMYVRDSYNNVPVHRAASMGHVDVVDMLITVFECDPRIRGYQRRSLLHFACGSGNAKLLDLIVQRNLLDPLIDRDACGFTPLHIAALCGHKEITTMLITVFNCPINCINEGAESPLHVACINGHTNIVKLLVLEYKARFTHNFQEDSPLQLAVQFGYIDVAKTLINDFNCNPNEKGLKGRTILHEACLKGHVELAETLITDFGLDPMCVDDDEYTPLHYAALGGHLSVVKMLISQPNVDLNAHNNQNDSLLHIAARGGHTNVVKALINDFSCNPNEERLEGRTILHEVCLKGHVELAETLITDFSLDPMCVDDNEYTPLHYAALGGHLSVVKMLISQHNADLNARNNQNDSPLHTAARGGHTNVVKALINDFNCNPNEKGLEGRTILHEACLKGHVELAERLIVEFGLDPTCVDYNKSTPLHYAAIGGHLSVVKMLVSQHNADINVFNNEIYSPLHIAKIRGHSDVVNAMINELYHKTDMEGLQFRAALTSFSHACEKKYEDLALTLITDLVCLSPLSTDSDGNTLLHIAAMYEQEQCVHTLLYTYNAPVYLRNSAGKTAREMTKSSSIRAVIDNYLKQNLGNIQTNYKEMQLLSSKKYSGEQRLTRVFVVGNVMSGKSTLIESLKREGFFDYYFSEVSENTVPLHTSGIVPSVHNSKTIGRVLYYDFAGDLEYYSSHSAIISNVMWSSAGTNLFLPVVNFSKDIPKIQEELGYWLSFITYHNKNMRTACTVVVIGSHTDLVMAVDVHDKIGRISKFVDMHFTKSSTTNIQIHKNILTLNCRQPRSTQLVRDAIAQISKDTPPFNLSLEAAFLLGLLEKDFRNVVTCKYQDLISHIENTGVCLPTAAESLYLLAVQLHRVGLLMIIGGQCDKLEDHLLLLNISKLTNDVHKLLFSSCSDSDTNLCASMGILPESYLNSILPEHITTNCLVQLQYCQLFSHIEVKADYITPSKSESSKLFYFPALCKAEKNECSITPLDFNYYIGCYIECKGMFDYFPPRFLHVLLLRLAYSYALQTHNNASTDLEPVLAIIQCYNRRCTMWNNGIHWLMEEGVECFVEIISNSKGIVIVTKSKDAQNSSCIEMLYKIIREIQAAKEEFCDSVTLQHFLMNSGDPASFADKDKLFAMGEVECVLTEGNPFIISINGRGHLDSAKIKHFMKCTLWSQLFPLKISDILTHITSIITGWHSLGIHLNIPSHILEEIRANNPNNVIACKEQMISKWMDSESLATPSCWWSLVNAIKGLGKNLIAKKIEGDHGGVIHIQERLIDPRYSDQKPEDDFLQSFAVVVGKEWPHLASLLSLSTRDIMEELKKRESLPPADQALYMLQKWKLKEGATYSQLCEKLRTVLLIR